MSRSSKPSYVDACTKRQVVSSPNLRRHPGMSPSSTLALLRKSQLYCLHLHTESTRRWLWNWYVDVLSRSREFPNRSNLQEYGPCKHGYRFIYQDLLIIPLGSDFADEFPGCEVTGTDISPIQPSFVPPNLKLSVSHSCPLTVS